MAIKIYPTETSCIENKKFDLSNLKKPPWWEFWKWDKHLQGIAQAGPYTVLSSSVATNELILAYNFGNEKKVVQVKSLPDQYEHAGGIDVLDVQNGENGENGWMIVVPVYYKTPRSPVSDDKRPTPAEQEIEKKLNTDSTQSEERSDLTPAEEEINKKLGADSK